MSLVNLKPFFCAFHVHEWIRNTFFIGKCSFNCQLIQVVGTTIALKKAPSKCFDPISQCVHSHQFYYNH